MTILQAFSNLQILQKCEQLPIIRPPTWFSKPPDARAILSNRKSDARSYSNRAHVFRHLAIVDDRQTIIVDDIQTIIVDDRQTIVDNRQTLRLCKLHFHYVLITVKNSLMTDRLAKIPPNMPGGSILYLSLLPPPIDS